jgi:hypothetical protein
MAKRKKKDKTTNNYLQNTTHKTISKNCGEYPLYQLHFLINVSTFNTIYSFKHISYLISSGNKHLKKQHFNRLKVRKKNP